MASLTVMHSTNPNPVDAVSVENSIDALKIRPKTVADLWREIVGSGNSDIKECTKEDTIVDETLQDFLVTENDLEDIAAAMELEFETEEDVEPFQNTVNENGNGDEGEGAVGKEVSETMLRDERRKRGRVVLEPLDDVSQKKQTRMMKNRESAVRSRERKQAYQRELEALAIKLEEENEQLQREKTYRTKQRYKQLMEKVVPVVENRKPSRTLKRVHSI